MQEIERFTQTIDQIAGEVKSLDVPDELFVPKAFIAIYESPLPYLNQAKAMIARRDVSDHEKMIVGFSMQRLPVDRFVEFASALIDSVNQGYTNIQVLQSAVFAPFNWGRQPLVMHIKIYR